MQVAEPDVKKEAPRLIKTDYEIFRGTGTGATVNENVEVAQSVEQAEKARRLGVGAAAGDSQIPNMHADDVAIDDESDEENLEEDDDMEDCNIDPESLIDH